MHLYYKTVVSKQISEVVEAFEFCEALDISKVDEVKSADVYFVEFQEVEKTLLLHIRKLLSSKKNSLIYFFIDDSQNLMLFQLASLLNVRGIITPKHETKKVISNIKADILLKKTTAQNKEIAKDLSDNFSFMVFDKKSLTFASEKLLSDFKCKDLSMLELNLFSKIDLKQFLEDDMATEESIALEENSKKYSIKSITSKTNSKKYIFIEEILQNKETNKIALEFIKNRIYLIEVLKEKLLEKNFYHNTHSIITISVENMDQMRKFWSEYEIEMAVRDLLLEIEQEIGTHTTLAQYDCRLYIALFENLSFEETKQKAQTMQKEILEYTSKEEIKPIIGLHVFDINDFELNDALKIISDISKEKISSKDIESHKIYKIIHIDSEYDDEKIIDILLQATFTNHTPIKLLNIYKGLCINTPSAIVKKTQEEIYVSFEHLQGTVMEFEKKTVIQSQNFTRDIAADVKLIDLKKRVALLKNFRFVSGSANARKYSRVTSSQRTPISIINKKGALSGEIIDVSMNSIAIRTRVFNRIEELNSTEVQLRFTLPIKSSEDGYMKLELDAIVSLIKCSEEYCNIVVVLEEDQKYESTLMEYVYDRQKEIIVELKKQTIIRS